MRWLLKFSLGASHCTVSFQDRADIATFNANEHKLVVALKNKLSDDDKFRIDENPVFIYFPFAHIARYCAMSHNDWNCHRFRFLVFTFNGNYSSLGSVSAPSIQRQLVRAQTHLTPTLNWCHTIRNRKPLLIFSIGAGETLIPHWSFYHLKNILKCIAH